MSACGLLNDYAQRSSSAREFTLDSCAKTARGVNRDGDRNLILMSLRDTDQWQDKDRAWASGRWPVIGCYNTSAPVLYFPYSADGLNHPRVHVGARGRR